MQVVAGQDEAFDTPKSCGTTLVSLAQSAAKLSESTATEHINSQEREKELTKLINCMSLHDQSQSGNGEVKVKDFLE